MRGFFSCMGWGRGILLKIIKNSFMPKKDFFENQSAETATKIKFYQEYLTVYLFKILMSYGKCFIADFFCGPGKNGKKNGSPLVLIDIANKVVNNETVKSRHPDLNLFILFNDENRHNIALLNSELSKLNFNKNIVVLKPSSLKFSDVINNNIIDVIKNKDIPKFFFLDPFSYSTISMDELKKIFSFPMVEILLFLPTFFSYRFSEAKKIPPKTKKFLKEFTTGGIDENYGDFGIYRFNNAIKEKLVSELDTKYVGCYLIDAGKTKNTLFLISKRIEGMIVANKIFQRYSADGECLDAKEIGHINYQQRLFDPTKCTGDKFISEMKYEMKLVEILKKHKRLKNTELFEFTVINQVLPKQTNAIIKKLDKKRKIRIEYLTSDYKKGSYYISESNKNNEKCIISYKE